MLNSIICLNIKKLFGEFDYSISFDSKSNLTILTAPNGYGKSTILGIINAFATGNSYYIAKIEFREIEFQFSNGTSLFITRKKSINGSTVSYKYLGIEAVKRYSNNIAENEASLVAAIFPFLTRISPLQWRHNQTGEIYELDQIYDKFGQHPALRRSFAIAPWFDDLRSKFKVTFVNTNRLIAESDGRAYRGFSSHGLTISTIAEIVKDTINDNLLYYFNKSRELETSFAKRLIASLGTHIPISREMIDEKIKDIQRIENQYQEVGLVPQTLQSDDMDLAAKDESTLNVLRLYLDDLSEKYGYLQNLARSLELFKTSLNELFEHKKIEISLEKGFVIRKTKNGEELLLSTLSSGEQHLIVLLGRLLFGTSRDSLVMIDEPEISLHPYWLERITSIFEKIQAYKSFNLIFATHSPALIGDRWDKVVELSKQVEF